MRCKKYFPPTIGLKEGLPTSNVLEEPGISGYFAKEKGFSSLCNYTWFYGNVETTYFYLAPTVVLRHSPGPEKGCSVSRSESTTPRASRQP